MYTQRKVGHNNFPDNVITQGRVFFSFISEYNGGIRPNCPSYAALL